MTPQNAAGDKLAFVLTALRETINMLSTTPALTPSNSSATSTPEEEIKVKRLEGVIEELKAEIGQYHKDNAIRATETQAMFDRFVADHRIVSGDVGDISVDLMIAPARDEEKERLHNIKQQLDEERRKFTEAAVKLGKEKAALEVFPVHQTFLANVFIFSSLGGASPITRRETLLAGGNDVG